MKQLNILAFSLFMLLAVPTFAQAPQTGPFLEDLYDVEVERDVTYGVNATILPIIAQVSSEALPRELKMDIYSPQNDDNEARPVMLVLHSGNFLPYPNNNGTSGTKEDSTVVEICNRLAARGYVAASLDYRLGWNPLAPSQDLRKFFLINAAYRGVQDARTAVRYFRKSIVDDSNKYGIDEDKFGIIGVGTGGYISSATATIDEYAELLIPKFLIDLDGPGPGPTVPMVIESVNGNVDGTNVGIVPAGYPILPEGDTLNYPNHATYDDGTEISSDIAFVVNMGGALGDSSWIDENTPPWVSFHTPEDQFAPYMVGTLTVPNTGDPADPDDDFAVVEISGSYSIQAKTNEFGNNDIFATIDDDIEDYRDVAQSRNNGYLGLFPFPSPDESAPWDFYAEDNINVGIAGPPDPVRARTYLDTIFAYMGPRACVSLGLACNITSTELLNADELGVKLAPNPASTMVTITTESQYTINHIELYDMNGRLVETYFDVNTNTYNLHRKNLSSGMYFARLSFDEGIAVRRLIFK